MKQGLIYAIFDKDIHSLTQDDILHYFSSEKRETNTIEFKAYIDDRKPGTTKEGRDNEKLDTIIKTICGFLNSDGGILIWGAPGGKRESGNEEVYKGHLTPVELQIEPDQFINKISSVISPIPLRILFQAIRLTENSFCYVLEVDKSEFSPHQYKGTYYMRMDGSTRPAPHHYVEALMKKISFPRLFCSIEFGEMINPKNIAYVPLVVTIHNLSKFIQDKKVRYQLISRGADILEPNQTFFNGITNMALITKNAVPLLHYNMPYYGNYVLVVEKMKLNYKNEAEVKLIVWGELSPAISCNYKLHISCDERYRVNEYSLEILHDNIYLMDIATEDTKSDKERLGIINNKYLEIYSSKLKYEAIHQCLSDYNPG